MNFNLKTPCNNCPFRKDVEPYISAHRAEEIAKGIYEQQRTFTCHKHLERDGKKEEHCAGALVILEKMKAPNQMMRIAERFGSYKHKELKMDAPVYKDLYEFIGAHKKANVYG